MRNATGSTNVEKYFYLRTSRKNLFTNKIILSIENNCVFKHKVKDLITNTEQRMCLQT